MTLAAALRTRPLDGLIADVTAACASEIGARDRDVAAALKPWLGRADLLDGCRCPPRESCYVRHVLHADPTGRFTLLALVWRPGQASPIHAHRAWCAFGVQNGTLTESYFDAPAGDETPAWRIDRPLVAGDCGHGAAGPAVHRLANRASVGAVSLHVYGVARAAIETGVNRVYG